MPAVAVVAVAAVAGAAISANSAKSAARTQARAIGRAADIAGAGAAQAKSDVVGTMLPAIREYGNEIERAKEQVRAGTADVMRILQTSTGNAVSIIGNAGANAKKALLGSAASSAGISRQGFDAQWSRISQMPAEAQDVAINNMAGTIADRVAQTTGESPQTVGTQIMDTLGTALTGFAEGGPIGMARALHAARTTPETPATPTTPVAQPAAPQPGAMEYGVSPVVRIDEQGNAITADGQIVPAASSGYVPEAGPEIGFAGADKRLLEGQAGSLAELAGGISLARQDVREGTEASLATLAATKGEALGRLDPYSEAGQQALQQELALSGALGPEAQQAAIDAFIESPGQAYLRKQQEQTLLRNASAIGGLGGGRVRTALQEQAMGIASTQQQQYMENLRNLALRGQEADTTGASIIQSIGQTGAGIQASASAQLASLAQTLGVTAADIVRMTATERAQLAERTGINVAQLEQMVGMAQAEMVQQLGSGLANVKAGSIADIARLTETGATNTLSARQNLASMQANIGIRGATQVANFTAQEGSALAAGTMAAGKAWSEGIQSIGSAAAMGMTAAPTTTATPRSDMGATIYPYTPPPA